MIRISLFSIIALTTSMASAVTRPAGDSLLWYDTPATEWRQALPVGNGQLGAMVFGGLPKERIQFNEHTVWTGKPHNYAHPGAAKFLPEIRQLLADGKQKEAQALAMKEFMSVPIRQKAYQPCGDLFIETPGSETASNYRRWLDLDSGLATTEWTTRETSHRRETFASHPANLVVTRLSADRPGMTSATIRLTTPHTDHQIAIDGTHTLVLRGKVEADGVAFEARAVISHQGGKLTENAGAIEISGADSIEIRLTAATNVENWQSIAANPAKRVADILARSTKSSYQDLLDAHLTDHRALFRRVSIDLGRTPAADLTTERRIAAFRNGDDPQLAALLFQYGRYLMIGCSRAGGQPANLQGIWNDHLKPPWDSKYTCNINTQMNYWIAEVGNLPECHTPLFKALEEMKESGAITAREHYAARGWVLHHNFDLWRGTAPINNSNHGIWPTGGAWLSLHLWENFLYSGDRDFLKKSWPILRGSAEFFSDYLIEDPINHWLISGPSNSPEQGGLVMGPTMDHQIIRQLFIACSRAARILKTDEKFAEKIDAMIPRIAPNQIGKHGQLQEWLEDKDDPKSTHRHVSHLWAAYPGAEITWQQPELLKAARQSLIFRGDAATGWSMGWKTNLWARLLDGDHAYLILGNLLNPVFNQSTGMKGGGMYENLFCAHPPFQIDGNFGGAAGVAEMLLQSNVPAGNNEATPRFIIHLLPALPKAWPTGSIKGFRARGGITVDFSWKDGMLSSATLTPMADGPISIRFGKKTVELPAKAGSPLKITGDLKPAVEQ